MDGLREPALWSYVAHADAMGDGGHVLGVKLGRLK